MSIEKIKRITLLGGPPLVSKLAQIVASCRIGRDSTFVLDMAIPSGHLAFAMSISFRQQRA